MWIPREILLHGICYMCITNVSAHNVDRNDNNIEGSYNNNL